MVEWSTSYGKEEYKAEVGRFGVEGVWTPYLLYRQEYTDDHREAISQKVRPDNTQTRSLRRDKKEPWAQRS